MFLSQLKGRVGKTALALGLGVALAWSVLVGGPTGHQATASVSGESGVIVVADGSGNNPPPGSG
jgi:hypothetical protein